MGAVIVQCPSCQARFHLAQERIPEKGARVRCSRCEHRFYVTSTGDVTQSKPRKGKGDTGERAAQSGSSSGSTAGGSSANSLELSSSGSASQPRVRNREAATTAMDAMREPAKPARPRSLGAVAPEEDADLDDPQFLFDETQSSAELPYTPGELGPEDEEPSSAALGDMPGRGRAGRSPDTDVTPQAPPEPEPESPPARAVDPESSGSWLSNDDEAIPDIRAHRDELAAQHNPAALADPQDGFEVTSSSTPERQAVEAPAPPATRAARAEAPRTPPREPAEAPEAGRYAGSGAAVLVARSTPERPGREAAAPPVDGPLSPTLERVGMLVSALMACMLIFAGGHALLLQLRPPAGPERVRLARGEVSSVEVLHLRDTEGHRVLAVRGLLRSSGDPPRVLLQLIDANGGTVGPPQFARPGFLGDAELVSEKLGALLAPMGLQQVATDARGFTVLVRDPPLEAERFTLELAG